MGPEYCAAASTSTSPYDYSPPLPFPPLFPYPQVQPRVNSPSYPPCHPHPFLQVQGPSFSQTTLRKLLLVSPSFSFSNEADVFPFFYHLVLYNVVRHHDVQAFTILILWPSRIPGEVSTFLFYFYLFSFHFFFLKKIFEILSS